LKLKPSPAFLLRTSTKHLHYVELPDAAGLKSHPLIHVISPWTMTAYLIAALNDDVWRRMTLQIESTALSPAEKLPVARTNTQVNQQNKVTAHTDINKDIMEIHRKMKETSKTDEVKSVTNNAFFVGSTSDLAKMIEDQTKGVKKVSSKTKEIIQRSNRAYGSKIEGSILEEVFSKLINLFSKFMPPSDIRLFRDQQTGFRDIFPIIDRFKVGPLEFEVLESLGGHLYGQVFFFCPDYGLLFTGDSLINLDSLTEDRKRFNLLAKHLMTSVNVDSEAARMEREALVRIATENDKLQKTRHNRCLVCGGHGAISVLERDILDSYGHIEHYPRLRISNAEQNDLFHNFRRLSLR
jgi:hypothetical protein